MNTIKSAAFVQAFKTSGRKSHRKVEALCKTLPFTPDRIFHLLCPSREYDRIKGWPGELIFTDSGYAEDNCIFKTIHPDVGEEIWICTRYEPDRVIEYVRVSANLCVKLEIRLVNNQDGSTTIHWISVYTALNETGNRIINKMDERAHTNAGIFKLLEHYLETGKLWEGP